MKYTFVKDYKYNEHLRQSFNELTEKTFGFNFNNWFNNGFWGEKYIPHSIMDTQKIVANISVNLMDFNLDGEKKHYIQLGTVMTDSEYRGQGLSRYLMNQILFEYQHKVDGIYLFGNDRVIDFYPKFGFKISKEYQYSKMLNPSVHNKQIEQVDMSNPKNWDAFFNALSLSVSNDRFTMDNKDLLAFWVIGSNLVYYYKEEHAYILAKVKDNSLMIYQVIADHHIDLDTIINAFGGEFKSVKLGFTPFDTSGYQVVELQEEDTTLFILGDDLHNIERKKLLFPTLSHA